MPGSASPPSPSHRNLLAPVLVTFAIVAIAGGIVLYSFSDFGGRARARKLQNPVPATPAAIEAGMNIYVERCQNCHGASGDGKGPKSEQLSVAPADFRDPRAMGAITDGELYWRITKGAGRCRVFRCSVKMNAGRRSITSAPSRSAHLPNNFRRATRLFHGCKCVCNFFQIRDDGNVVILEPCEVAGSIARSQSRDQ